MIVTAVILAAGLSTRFPGNKLVTEVELDSIRAPLIYHTIRKFIESRVFDNIVVVVGHEKEKVIDAVDFDSVAFVINRRYREGMSSSVKAGVAAVMPYSDIVAIHPGDLPFIKPTTLRNLISVASTLMSGGDFVVIPRYVRTGKGGHPLVVSKGLLRYVLEIGEETRGLKGFLRRFGNYIVYVPTEDVGTLADVDTPQDLARMTSTK